VSTTRDDRIVGLRRRGKRKAAAAAKELYLNFSLSGFCENLKRSRREREEDEKNRSRV